MPSRKLETCATCGQPLMITPSGFLACTAWHGRLIPADIYDALRHWPDPLEARLVHVDDGDRLYVLGFRTREATASYWIPWFCGPDQAALLRRCYLRGGAVLALDEDRQRQILVRVDTLKRVLAPVRRRRLAAERAK